ncbi:hypothetical protein ACHAXS_000262 [Conticribra weissflogii]
MACPNHNIPIHIYTDASDYQMGAVISKKLTDTKQNYHIMEKELLSIAMVLETFHSILLVAKLFIYTNYKILTFANLNYCCILHWQSFVEEYGPPIIYHPGKKVIANSFF